VLCCVDYGLAEEPVKTINFTFIIMQGQGSASFEPSKEDEFQ
jgi:hypothetical protein